MVSKIVDSPMFYDFGVGRFGWEDIRETTPSRLTGDQVFELKVRQTLTNVAGWLPVVSVVAGIFHSIKGVLWLGDAFVHQNKTYTIIGAAGLFRGLLEIGCFGWICAPFDIGCTAVRLYRDAQHVLRTPTLS